MPTLIPPRNLPGTTTPVVASTGVIGTSLNFARDDHIHPAQASTAPRIDRYSATTNGSGVATFAWSAFGATPKFCADAIVANDNTYLRTLTVTTTGATVRCYTRAIVTVLGIDLLAGSPTAVSGQVVTCIVMDA